MHDLIHLHDSRHPLHLEIYYSLKEFFGYWESLIKIISRLPATQRDTANLILSASMEGMDQADILDLFRGI